VAFKHKIGLAGRIINVKEKLKALSYLFVDFQSIVREFSSAMVIKTANPSPLPPSRVRKKS